MRVLLILALCCLALPARALEAGAASAEITPDIEAFRVPLAGYGARQGKPAEGVHDPLYAKVLYLRDEAREMALVTADLRSVTPELKALILDALEGGGFTTDNLFLAGSHTHSGPSIYPETVWQRQFGVHEPEIVRIMAQRIAAALEEARANAVPARIGYHACETRGFTRNRRWSVNQEAREAAGETPQVDNLLRVLRVDTLEGEPIAVLVNFATHPTILGADNFLISAEWPGVLQRELEAAFPGTVALFTNGAEGDQAPAGAQGEDAFARMEDFGTRLAAEAAACLRQVETAPDAPIAYVRVTPELPAPRFSEGALAGPYADFLEAAHEELPRQAELQLFRIGDAVLVGLPGEPVYAVGEAMRRTLREAQFQHIIVVGLANDYIGYILDAREYAHGGYEVDLRSFYGPGLGMFLTRESGQAALRLRE